VSAEFNFHQLVEAVSGESVVGKSDRVISGVQTNSKEVQPGNLFVARRGQVADGHRYIDDAISRDASALVVDKQWLNESKSSGDFRKYESSAVVAVDSTSEALLSLATWWRKQLSCPVIAITGSNGKTTTKEILSALLSDLIGKGVASQGSYNNEVGVPLTILAAERTVSWLVLEMGMNHSGELTTLSRVGAPDTAMILNIAPAHIGNFSGISEIADAKCEIVAGLKTEGTLVLPDFDEALAAALERRTENRKYRKVFFGSAEKDVEVGLSEISSSGLAGIDFELHIGGESVEVSLPLLGEHNAFNAAAAVAALSHLFSIELRKIAESLAQVKGARMRLEVNEYEEAIIINDAYNANPRSVSAALDTLESFDGPLIVVLGDMGELGEDSSEFHREVGRKVARLSPVLLVAVGDHSSIIAEGVGESSVKLLTCPAGEGSVEKISDAVLSEISIAPQRPVILVKGSRLAGLERVVEGLDQQLTFKS